MHNWGSSLKPGADRGSLKSPFAKGGFRGISGGLLNPPHPPFFKGGSYVTLSQVALGRKLFRFPGKTRTHENQWRVRFPHHFSEAVFPLSSLQFSLPAAIISSMVKENWLEVRLLMPLAVQEDAACFLTEFSGRGVILEEKEGPEPGVRIRAYFLPEEFGAWQQEELQRYLSRLRCQGLYPLGLEMHRVAAEDWAEAWKAHFKTRKVTPRLVVRPPWEEYASGPEEIVITIYPAMAFGTGRHPSTLLCLRALEEVWGRALPPDPKPWQVLDVGTGSGILALAAARLGAGVLAIDVDPEAVAAALENVRLNALEEQVLVEATPLSALRQQFALILANLTAPDLLELAEALTARLLGGGALIISGFLQEDRPRLEERFLSLGLQAAGFFTEEDWGALILRRV